MGKREFSISVDLFDFDEELEEDNGAHLLAHIGIDTDMTHFFLNLHSLDACERAFEELLDAATWLEDFLTKKGRGNRGRS